MKVNLRNIGESPFSLEEEISPEDWGMDSEHVKFVDKIRLLCEFRKAGSELLVDVEVETSKKLTCFRCLETVNKNDCDSFMLSFDISDLSNVFEVNEAIREELLLNWPMKLLCSDDCKGLDPNTGNKL